MPTGNTITSDQRDAASDDEEDDTVEMYSPRDEGISAIVRKYKTHPFVIRAIQNQKTSYYTPKGDNATIDDFFAEAGTYALLSAEDERELFGYIEHGYQLYEQLGGFKHLTPEQEEAFVRLTAAQQVVYHANLRLAISVAKPYIRYQGNHLQPMDHIQEALIGLSNGINRFDVTKGFKFSTYATNWIRQNVTRAIGDKSRVIRMPIHSHQKYLTIKRKVQEYGDALGRPLTTAEIESASGMSYEKYGELMRRGAPNIPSLDEALVHQDRDLGDLVGYNHMDMAVDAFSDREELAAIIGHAELKAREKLILGLRFGLEPGLFGNPTIEIGNKQISYAELFMNVQTNPKANTEKTELTLEELGDIFGLTRERIRQIQNNALAVLQASAKYLGKKSGAA